MRTPNSAILGRPRRGAPGTKVYHSAAWVYWVTSMAGRRGTLCTGGLLVKFIFFSAGMMALSMVYLSYGLQSRRYLAHGVFVSPEERSGGSTTTNSPSVISILEGKVHDATSHSPSTSDRTRGFLLAANYDQQLQAALGGYCQLAKLTGLLNLSAVEPFVLGTTLVGVPAVGSEIMRLGDLYELEHLTASLKSNRVINELVSFKTFAGRASRRAILVYFLTDLTQFQGIYFSGNNRSSRIVEIDPKTFDIIIYDLIKKLNRWSSAELGRHSKRFITSRVVFIDARPYHPLPLSNITEKLNSIISEEVWKFGSATVVIERWRGIHAINDSKFFYFVPGFAKVSDVEIQRALRFSVGVVSAARRFSQTLNPTRPVIGVHIRGERLLLDSKGNASLYLHCFQQLKHVLFGGPVKAAREQVCLFHDLGPYGTTSCTLTHCVDSRSHFVEEVKKLSLPVVSFDPAAFDGVPRSPAFASLVEMEYLSRVDVLVAVGRGGFQQSVVHRFLDNTGGRTDRLHRICSSIPASQ